MKNINLIKTDNSSMKKNNIKIIFGGPLGILAWSASAGSMLIIFFWGLEKSALAVIAVKTVSWGMWGVGVIRESAYFSFLEGRITRIRQARKLRAPFSWGLYLYLCSLGERGLLRWREMPGHLQFYYVYYVPGDTFSSLEDLMSEQPMVRLEGLPAKPIFVAQSQDRLLYEIDDEGERGDLLIEAVRRDCNDER